MALTETAPAKLNLYLHVTGRRDDGYHELSSLTVFLDHQDTVRLETSRTLGLQTDGPFSLQLSETAAADNLVLRAVHFMNDMTGHTDMYQVSLTKNIPAGAGLGGGSADAAAVIRLLCAERGLDPVRFSQDHNDRISALGADVPVCVLSRPAHMHGIGERTDMMSRFPAVPVVIVYPGVSCRTADIFKGLPAALSQASAVCPPAIDSTDALLDFLLGCDNHLYPPAAALCPQIDEVLAALAETDGCRLARMTGSGSACFAIYDTDQDAERAARALAEKAGGQGYSWWVKQSRILGT